MDEVRRSLYSTIQKLSHDDPPRVFRRFQAPTTTHSKFVSKGTIKVPKKTVITVGTIDSKIAGPYPIAELDRLLSYHPTGYRYEPHYRSGRWDGWVHLFSTKKEVFPTGLLSTVQSLLNLHRLTHAVNKRRESVDLHSYEIPGVELRPYQQKCVLAMLRHKRGVIKVPTAGGKTLIAAAALKAFDQPAVYIVHTSTLLKQTLEVFEKIFPGDVGVVGAGEKKWRKITICMVQTLVKLIEKKQTTPFDDYKVLMCDECHHVASGKRVGWYVAARQFRNAWIRFGLSATPVLRKRGMLLIGATGPLIVNIPMSELQDEGYISESEVTFYKYDRRRLLDPGYSWLEVYRTGIVECEKRNQLGCRLALEQAGTGKLVLMFVELIEHGQTMVDLLRKTAPATRIYFLSGLDQLRYVSEIKQLAKEKRLDILIVTRKLFGEGVDIPAVDALISLAGGQSVITFTQMFGRGLRISEGKSHLTYIDFYDESHDWLERHSASRVGHCKKLKQVVTIKEI